jgi:hypothetical protein
VGYSDDDVVICAKACAEQMNRLWYKSTVIMKTAQGGVRPFVKLVMQHLQQAVVQELKAAGRPWDCSAGPEKMDAGPDEVEVTSVSKDGVFVCKEAHEFQVAASYDSSDPTALQVVSPSDDAVAAGFSDGQVVFVCRSATRALPIDASSKSFKCQSSPATHPIQPFPSLFQCTVHSASAVMFSVMASAHDPTNPKFVPPPGAASPPVKLWMVSKNAKGFFTRNAQKLSDKVDVTFTDSGSGLPPGIVAGRYYQLTCIATASFELMPQLISLAADWSAAAMPLRLRRVETAQRGFRRQALKHHEKGDTAAVKWASIKAQNLSRNVNDFANIFCSGSKDSVDVFETETNGELLFNMMIFCKEFAQFHEFLSPNTCFDSSWTMQRSSFSLQPYWVRSSDSDVRMQEPCSKLRGLSAQASNARNMLMHSDLEMTITEFEKAYNAFVDLLEEIVKVCSLLLVSAAAHPEMRPELLRTIEFAKGKIKDIRQRRLSKDAPTLQEQHEADDLRKQFLLEKQRAENLEQQNKSLQLQVEEQQDRIEGNSESLQASLDQIASFSQSGDHDIEALSRVWASGSRQPLLCTIRDAVSATGRVVCVHGRHGCGKSSALSQIITQLRRANAGDTLVLSFMFKFGDAASSVDVALASLCVQLWQNALGKVCLFMFFILLN